MEGLRWDSEPMCEDIMKAKKQYHSNVIGAALYKRCGRPTEGACPLPPAARHKLIPDRMSAKMGHTLLLLLCMSHCLKPFRAFYLQPCEPINETVSVEKEGCPKCLVFQAAICSGHCLTKEPVYKSPLSAVYQHVCTYRDVRYETIRLPDCPPGVDPHVTYPVALSCDCSLCTMETSDCTIESLRPDFCMSQRALLDIY